MAEIQFFSFTIMPVLTLQKRNGKIFANTTPIFPALSLSLLVRHKVITSKNLHVTVHKWRKVVSLCVYMYNASFLSIYIFFFCKRGWCNSSQHPLAVPLCNCVHTLEIIKEKRKEKRRCSHRYRYTIHVQTHTNPIL